MTFFKIAFRNVIKNRRRSVITTMAIAFGFMAVAMFKGYTHQAYEKIALGAIFVEIPGHIVVFKKGFLEEGKLYPEQYLFSREESRALRSAIEALPRVSWVAEKLQIAGLISNGDVSTIFLSDAMEPSREQELWRNYTYRKWTSRTLLPADRPDAVFLGPELLALLKLKQQDNAVLMATTQYGQMNAADATIWGTYATFSDEMNDKYARLPLGLAQSLYDTDGCDRLCVLLDDASAVELTVPRIQEAAEKLGMEVEVKTWIELSQYYQKATDFLDVVFLFLFTITCIIVVMGTINTMSMSIYERIREIGTLRAIGLKPLDVIRVFSIEGSILGVVGSIVGVALTVFGKFLVGAANIRYKPPGVAESVQVEVDLVPGVLLLSFVVFVCLAVVSAAVPARRAARQNIVDALSHV